MSGDMKEDRASHSAPCQFVRIVWSVAWPALTWFLPRSVGSGWKRWLLRLFGAQVHPTAVVYTGAKIYYPANLRMDARSCLATGVDCYNVDKVVLCEGSTVSQDAYLCTASHDISDPAHRLVTAPICIGARAWVGARAFVGMGVTLGEGAVAGAMSVVTRDVAPWTVVAGNPATEIKRRVLTAKT
ncbi:MAG: putative colanic acid biosynthesis acetyltransferase [Alloprevotella sp.]|nr:putative colanic acid biosynthesis acetyltransferase [Alloprevotella sp.]MBR1732323.1 putative colanic acid biosynthesis acetyltransferase [Alloprevotella sp.]